MIALDPLFRILAPREQLRTIVWGCRHTRDGDGRPYSHDLYPHLGAPGGPADAMDDPAIRQVILQFASRLGKTFFGQMCLMKKADDDPGPAMFLSSIEKTAMEVIERTYRMIGASPRVADQLRPESRRRSSVIDFAAMQCYIAWSRSPSTMADKEIEFGHGNEVDKLEQQSTSQEGDPLELFLERLKNRPHHKVILESTPTVKGHSRVEALRLGSSNCQFWVPCPHCGRYQLLEFDRIRWQKLSNGRSDKELARKTAHYVCAHCDAAIEDHSRPVMMRSGVWAPEGCTINDDDEAHQAISRFNRTLAAGVDGASVTDGYEWRGWKHATWIEGEPARDGTDAGYQLSSLYALSLGWGNIAAKFVNCHAKPQKLRNFINSWLARTWEHRRRETSWEQLGARIISKSWKHREIPAGYAVITAGVDKQDEHFVYEIDAWGVGQRSHTLDYGTAQTEDELLALLARPLVRTDGTPARIALALVDSGFRAKGIHKFCRRLSKAGIPALACKGAQMSLGVELKKVRLGKDTSSPGSILVHVDTIITQDWIEEQLHGREPGQDGSTTLYHASLEEHQDYLEQLLNDAPTTSDDGKRESWDRIDDSLPNDYRDTKRYAAIAMLIETKGKPLVERRSGEKAQPRRPFPRKRKGASPIEGRPGGWLNLP